MMSLGEPQAVSGGSAATAPTANGLAQILSAACLKSNQQSAVADAPITSADVVAFAKAAQAEGVSQAALSGGDPLFHPEVVPIVSGLKALGLIVKIDTVGTALLDSAQVVFKGRGQVAKVDLDDIGPHVDFVSIPLDGSRQETVGKFRRGRGNLFFETRAVAPAT